MDWVAFGDFIGKVGGVLIGLVGAIVAGIAVVLSHRERTSSYRIHLFEKQVDVLMEVADAAAQVVRGVLNAALTARETSTGEPLLESFPARETFIRLKQQSQVILPNAVNATMGQFLDAAWEVTGAVIPGSQRNTPPDLASGATEGVLTTYEALLASIRSSLGIDTLSDESLKVVRSASRPASRNPNNATGL